MDEMEEEEQPPLVSVMPNLDCVKSNQSLTSSPQRTTQKQTTMKASMTGWCRVMHWRIMCIKSNLYQPKSHLSCFWSWRLSCNKNCMVEMIQFLLKQPKLDQTKLVDHCRWCDSEGDCDSLCVAVEFSMNKMMRRQKYHRAKVLWHRMLFYVVLCNWTVRRTIELVHDFTIKNKLHTSLTMSSVDIIN